MPPDPHVLREYALLADGHRGALVDPQGDIAFACFPRWHDPALFSGLLGGRGHYSVTPRPRFVWGGYYEDGSLIWRSRWVCEDAIVECREALARPAGPERMVILRRLVALEGTARVRVRLAPAAEWGQRPPGDLRCDAAGVWHGRTGAVAFTWAGAGDARPEPGGLTLDLDLEEGAAHDLVLGVGGDEPPPDANAAWAWTEQSWRDDVPSLSATAAPRDARMAVAVLRGLTDPDGGTVAAPTTGLPERAERGRDYDYRYVWIRDQCYAGQAAARAEVWPLLDDAVSTVRDHLLADGPDLQPAYTVCGERLPATHDVPVPGYPGGAGRAGNHVRDQFQLDAFGEALLLLAAAAEHGRCEAAERDAMRVAADAIARSLDRPDAGVWELEPRVWTHSRLACVAGLRACREHLGEDARALEQGLRRDLEREGRHDGRWRRAADDDRVDGALLLGAIRGAVDPQAPVSVATRRAVAAELGEDGFVYRFAAGHRPLGEAEGAFMLCGFWMALACHAEGRRDEALRWFERNRSACGPPGLFSEEFDVRQRQLRGNIPQAFVHAVALETAATLG